MADDGSLPFAEQIAFFRQKLNLPTERWDDLLGAAHDRAFVVAGAMQADLLADLRAAVTKGIEQGTTLEEFREDFTAIVNKRGWSGWTGEGTAAGEAWRTKVIYATNLRTSHAAGRYAQLQEIKQARPYWRYVHNDTVRHPRPEHEAWNGTVLRADDPWWQTHFAPNGWGCRCRIESLADRDLERLGIDPQRLEAPTDPEDTSGIDKGWDYAPGRTWHPDLDKYPYETARDLVAANMRDGVFERWHARVAGQVAAALKGADDAGLNQAERIARLRKTLARGEEYPVAVLAPETVDLLGVLTKVVRLSDYDLIKQQVSRAGQAFDALSYLTVQGVLDRARLIVRENNQMTIFVSDASGQWYAAILQQTRSGEGVYLKSYRRSSAADAKTQSRKGVVLKSDL